MKDISKQEQKKLKKMNNLLKRALNTESIEDAFELIKKESGLTVTEKYVIAFNLGRSFERHIINEQNEAIYDFNKQNNK